MKSTGIRIWERREALKMSRAQLAKRLKTTRMRIWRIEHGTTKVRIEDLPSFARVLKLKITELVA